MLRCQHVDATVHFSRKKPRKCEELSLILNVVNNKILAAGEARKWKFSADCVVRPISQKRCNIVTARHQQKVIRNLSSFVIVLLRFGDV